MFIFQTENIINANLFYSNSTRTFMNIFITFAYYDIKNTCNIVQVLIQFLWKTIDCLSLSHLSNTEALKQFFELDMLLTASPGSQIQKAYNQVVLNLQAAQRDQEFVAKKHM